MLWGHEQITGIGCDAVARCEAAWSVSGVRGCALCAAAHLRPEQRAGTRDARVKDGSCLPRSKTMLKVDFRFDHGGEVGDGRLCPVDQIAQVRMIGRLIRLEKERLRKL